LVSRKQIRHIEAARTNGGATAHFSEIAAGSTDDGRISRGAAEDLELTREFCWEPDIIAVEKANPIRPRMGHHVIETVDFCMDFWLYVNTNASIQGGVTAGGLRGGAAIWSVAIDADDDFPPWLRLLDYALHTLAEELDAVVHGSQNCHERFFFLDAVGHFRGGVLPARLNVSDARRSQRMSATLVTAYYPIRSKFPPQQYMEWAARFMKLRAPIVLFTDPKYVEVFEAMRRSIGPLTVIGLPFEELDTWVLYKDMWIANHARDPEAAIHTPELYAVWAQKAFFVERAIGLNVYGGSHYFWCDIGAFRDASIPDGVLNSFPRADRLPGTGVLFSSVRPLDMADAIRQADGIVGSLQPKDRIVGGLWGGTADSCMRWRSAYEAMLIRYFVAGRFAGKDQSVMLSALLEDPSLGTVIKCTLDRQTVDAWFFLQYFVSDYSAAMQRDESYSAAPPNVVAAVAPIVVNVMGGLGNQMFQIAAAWSAARACHATVLLPKYKESDDGRSTYWDSVLHRWAHFVTTDTVFGTRHHFEKSATEYTPIPVDTNDALIVHGYFQSPKYFQAHADEIRMLMSPSAEMFMRTRQKYVDMLEARDRVVVVHARRTDYLKSPHHIAVHGPLGVAYYREALDRMCRRIVDPIFLLVSDDPVFWIEILSEVPSLMEHTFRLVSHETDVETLALLQQFRHFVIANSTFSWWAAFLSGSNSVIAPAKWFGPEGPSNYEDIYCEGWERI
jgi:hypothetical protein